MVTSSIQASVVIHLVTILLVSEALPPPQVATKLGAANLQVRLSTAQVQLLLCIFLDGTGYFKEMFNRFLTNL